MRKKSASIILIMIVAFLGLLQICDLTRPFSFADETPIKIGETGYPGLKEAFLAAKDGDVLTLEKGELEITEFISVPSEKNLTFDLKGNTLILATDKSNSSTFSTNAKGSFTIKNGKVTAKDIDGDGFTSGFMSSEDTDICMENLEVYGIKSDVGGSVLSFQTDINVNVNIKNCNFHDNRGSESGGVLKLRVGNKEGEGSEFNIINNKFINNRVESLSEVFRAAFGGAISLSGPGKYLIKDNEIIGNEAWAKHEYYYYGIHYTCGGGICLGGSLNVGGCEDVILDNNLISKNKAQFLGGGVSSQMDKSTDKLTIKSGVFSNNVSEFSGGGLDLSVHNQPFLVMDNVVIAKNKAAAGAGVWACPTSRVRYHSTYGAAILDNVLDNNVEKPRYGRSGTDVRFEGSDTKYKEILNNNDPKYHKMSIQDRTFLGNKVNWYADDPEALYKEGDPILTPDKYTDRSTSFGIIGKILSRDDWYEVHKKSANITFVGNIAKERGGAIATNTDIDFGEENLEINVKVNKVWKDKDGKELKDKHPKSATVRLIRKDNEGTEYELEDVKLNSSNDWSYIFSNLPSEGLVEGKNLKFTYEVKEINIPKGYKSDIRSVEPSEGIKEEFIIENKENIKEPPKPKTGDSNKFTELGGLVVLSIIAISGLLYKKDRTNKNA